MGLSKGRWGETLTDEKGEPLTKIDPWYPKGTYWGWGYPGYNIWYKPVKREGNRIDWLRVDDDLARAYHNHFDQYGTCMEIVQRLWGNHQGWLILEGWPLDSDGPDWWIS